MTGSATVETLLPWHVSSWEILRSARAANRFPHALLVTGPAGVGKRRLVSLLAHSLLCPHADDQGNPCGRCRDCALWAAGTHPDYVEIRPDSEGQSDEIRVDAVRRLAKADALTAHRGGYKVIVIDPAQNMNTAAANSLLKTLEEPSTSTLLCLICEQPSVLPATVRSRCQVLRVPVPPRDDALAWLRQQAQVADADADAEKLLNLAHSAPLRALALVNTEQLTVRDGLFDGFAAVGHGTRDPIAEAAGWNQYEPAILLDWLSGWISDLLRLASGHATPRLINIDKADALRSLARRIDERAGHRFLQEILRAKAAEGSTLNRLLLYESLLVEWMRVTNC
jgi:DNA polymerase-3 subunit delta'